MQRENNYAFTRQTLKIFWEHAKKYPWQIIILSIGVLMFIGFQNYTPILYRNLVNLFSQGNQVGLVDKGIKLVLLILLLNFLKLIIWRSTNFVNNFFQSRVMADLMNTCYQYLQRHSLGFFSSNFVGSLVTRVKRYERSFETITDQIYFDLGRSLLEAVGILIILLVIHPFFGLILLTWCVAFFVFSYMYARFKMPYDMKRAAADTRTTAQLADSITNNINIKLFTNYKKEDGKFFDVTNEQFKLRKKSWDLGSIGDLIQGLSMMILEFLVIFLAVRAWSRGELQIGDIVLLQVYLLRVTDKLWNTGKNIQRIYEALADANEMTEILLNSHEIKDDSGARILKPGEGAIDFKAVTFSYKNRFSVLENFNFSIKPGERVAFIGPSGGGKSTIARLLLRFYDINSGEILVDGQNVAKVTQDSLRASIALVPQDPILFHRSLMENIRYSKPNASDEEVIRAAKLAHADEFINSFPDKYNTLVGERGMKLSGGERQRVAIARAMLKNASILILDEATSSLDSESELYIQDALKKLMDGRTTLVIAHRLSTIMQMDRIVVIEKGKIIEQGKHKELLKVKKGLYQKLWGIQAGGFVKES